LVQLYQPHTNQQKIHRAINDLNHKYYVLNIGRQFGKTMLAMNQIYYWLFNDKGCKCAWVSPIYKQSKKVFDEMVQAFAGTGIISSNASELTIKVGKSTLQFFSSERYDNIRGFTFDYLVCDEFAFMDEQAWTEVLRATVLIKGKKVLLISTPKGRNHFYLIHQLEHENNMYKSFTMSSYDGLAIASEIDDARLTLPDHVFRQEYLAEFVDGGAGVFKDLNINNNQQVSKNCFAGLDVGRADDYTVLSIFNDNGKQCYINRWRQMDWSSIIKEVVEVLNRFKPELMIEVNGIGDPIFEQIKNQYTGYVYQFQTTSKSKQDIIEQMIVGNSNKDISFLDEKWLINELNVFTYEYNPKTRNVRYSAPNGFHDDGVMGTAIAYECYLKKGKRKEFDYTFRM
jgi:hypothetical protein